MTQIVLHTANLLILHSCKEQYQLNFLFLGKSNLNFCMAQNKLYRTSSYKMGLVNKKTELYSRPISQKKKECGALMHNQ
jgi:hypothetical protein